MTGTQSPEEISTRLQRIAELAKRSPKICFTSINHHIDLAWLLEAHRRTRKGGAAGIDGQTSEAYERDLEGNLLVLLEKAKTGFYRAPAVKRVHIPKGDGKETRPLGIPTFEDKILQRAVAMVLEAIYEQDFLDCSYGFRPGRSAHQALDVLREGLMAMKGGWIIEVDIRKFFDTLNHGDLRDILQQRVRDGVLLRLIGKWLNAGVLEDGNLVFPKSGTPQGGVISPLLANVYLHEVIDRWFEEVVKPRLKGHGFLVRYADDLVMVFSQEVDARRVMKVLPERFGRYGLTLHPTKTRLIAFKRPPLDPPGPGGGTSETFDLLGFTHYWGRSQKGHWVVKRKTAKDRFSRGLKAVAEWCRKHRHLPVKEQHRTLDRKLRGHYGYYGITGNSKALGRFREGVTQIWRKWLDRRSNRSNVTREWFGRLLRRYPLPPAIAIHSALRHVANP